MKYLVRLIDAERFLVLREIIHWNSIPEYLIHNSITYKFEYQAGDTITFIEIGSGWCYRL